MTAPAQPADLHADIADHRAHATELVAAYRDAQARLGDPVAAFACTVGSAYTVLCHRRTAQVLAAAVQVIAEMQDAAAGPADDFAPVEGPSLASIHRRWLDRGLPVSTWPDFLAAALRDEQADRAGVDRHRGPLAATGGELP